MRPPEPHGVFDLQAFTAIKQFQADVMHVAFSPDGALLGVDAVLEPIQLLDTATWATVKSLESLKHVHPTADDSYGPRFSPDGVFLAAGEARNRRRCYYRLTPAGRRTLAVQQENWCEFVGVVNELIGSSHA